MQAISRNCDHSLGLKFYENELRNPPSSLIYFIISTYNMLNQQLFIPFLLTSLAID